MVDITFDQLIADLCVAREKNPKIGTWKLAKSEIVGDNFFLEITNGKKSVVFAIEMTNIDEK